MRAPDEKPDPLKIAELFLKKYKNDVVKATNAMTESVMDNEALYRTIMDPLVRMACYDYVRQVCQSDRRKIWDTKQPTTSEESERIHHLGGGISSAYMMFPLPGGKLLKDATGAEAKEAGMFYLGQMKNMGVKGYWLMAVGKAATDKKIIGKTLNEETLAKLRTEAEKKV